jgi:hypothetical protein
MAMDRSCFQALLGPLEAIMGREMHKRQQSADDSLQSGAGGGGGGGDDGGGGGGGGGEGGGAAWTGEGSMNTSRRGDGKVVKTVPLDLAVRLADLTLMQTLGTGTFGRVKLVQHSRKGDVMALKCLQKTQVP